MDIIKAKEQYFKSFIRKPITRRQARAYRYIMNYKPVTMWDIKRLIEMIRLYNYSVIHTLHNENEIESILGLCVELGSHRPTSTIIRVRPKGKNDCYVKIDAYDKTRVKRLEVKTNSGQMQDLMELPQHAKDATYIHYYMDINVKPSKKNPSGIRQIEFICSLNYFFEVCTTYDCIKRNPSKDNKHEKVYNLRADNAKMFKHFCNDLQTGAVLPFDRRMVYTKEDFEE